ncbi:hypothetical protein [Emcibacter sp.]|uniref:hypothetical protein n=1 Tax=Emcibacter sp. TaxID=1979954 RepID=UPI002AA6EC33|nr:hypothetical protein [Emcibacter sp.]
MTMNNIVSDGTKDVTPSSIRSMTNLLVEMEKIGIDAEPFFILAAREFENIYRESAEENAHYLYVSAINENDTDNIYIWRKIYHYISDNSQNSLRNIH